MLGLPLRELDIIRKSFCQDIDKAFDETLLVWLRHRYDTSRHGLPTWKRLVEAVNSPAGGNNMALAYRIAYGHSLCKLYIHMYVAYIVHVYVDIHTVVSEI